MGNSKRKWTAKEEAALLAGVTKYGPGKWKNIFKDSELGPLLYSRSNIEFKDKWRNLSLGAISGQSLRGKAKSACSPAPVTPAPGSLAVAADAESNDAHMDDDLKCLLDGKTASKYNTFNYEALSTLKEPKGSETSAIRSFIEKMHEVPQNFWRLISSKLRRLVEVICKICKMCVTS